MQCYNDFAELYACNSISKPIKILIIVYLTPFIVIVAIALTSLCIEANNILGWVFVH